MKAKELEGWLSEGYRLTAPFYRRLDPDQWWPSLSIHGQGAATTWAWATILTAARSRDGGTDEEVYFSAPFHGKKHFAARQSLVSTLWTDNARRKHEPSEVVVDYAFHKWDAPSPIWMTAESELHAGHGVGESLLSSDDGYSWDFYKLMMVPSPLRLFLARVGAWQGTAGRVRRDELVCSLSSIVKSYGGALLRKRDELGIAIIPESAANDEWKDLRLLVMQRGELQESRPWA